jgi:Ser/Thr protein kinase RdoA (MazF antagonist)
MTTASPTDDARARLVRAAVERLAPHLEATYAINVSGVRPLDVGVFRVERADGPAWVARLFPAARPLEQAYGDAQVLRLLAETGYPAERCAALQPVSVLDGQAVLVTEHVAAVPHAKRAETIRAAGGYARLGALLGRLHGLPKEDRIARPGGCWHHLGDGTPRDELIRARELLADASSRVSASDQSRYRALQEELDRVEDAEGLPEALVHPDFVLANVIATPDQRLMLVGWTGAGWGPRIWSLAFLLYAAAARDLRQAARDLRRVGRVLAGYQHHVSLEPAEVTRLADIAAARPIVLEVWAFCLGRKGLAEAVEAAGRARALADAVASAAASSRWRTQ